MEYYTFEQLKEMAFKDGITGNKVAVGIWAKMNGFLKKKKQIKQNWDYYDYVKSFGSVLFLHKKAGYYLKGYLCPAVLLFGCAKSWKRRWCRF